MRSSCVLLWLLFLAPFLSCMRLPVEKSKKLHYARQEQSTQASSGPERNVWVAKKTLFALATYSDKTTLGIDLSIWVEGGDNSTASCAGWTWDEGDADGPDKGVKFRILRSDLTGDIPWNPSQPRLNVGKIKATDKELAADDGKGKYWDAATKVKDYAFGPDHADKPNHGGVFVETFLKSNGLTVPDELKAWLTQASDFSKASAVSLTFPIDAAILVDEILTKQSKRRRSPQNPGGGDLSPVSPLNSPITSRSGTQRIVHPSTGDSAPVSPIERANAIFGEVTWTGSQNTLVPPSFRAGPPDAAPRPDEEAGRAFTRSVSGSAIVTVDNVAAEAIRTSDEIQPLSPDQRGQLQQANQGRPSKFTQAITIGPDDTPITVPPDDVIGPPPDPKSPIAATQAVEETTVRSLSKILGIAADVVAGVAVVIYEFVKGENVAAAFTLVGTAIAVAAGVAGAGFFVVAAIGAIAILIGEAIKWLERPPMDDPTKVIQYMMFGDQKTTGNEKCRKGVDGKPPNDKCEVRYGTSVISYFLGTAAFDMAVFTTMAKKGDYLNGGYAMTIPDIVKNIKVVNNGANAEDMSKVAAVIDCQNPYNARMAALGSTGDGSCQKPKFKVNLDVILPVIERKASDVKDQMLGKKEGNGVCSVFFQGAWEIDDAQINGMPSGISCDIVGGVKLRGETVKFDANDNGGLPPTPYSDGDETTTGQDAVAYVAPPGSRVAFKAVGTSTGFACIGYDDRKLCLPNGKYGAQKDKISGIESKKVNQLTLPKDSKIAVETGFINAVYEGALDEGTHHWDKNIGGDAPKDKDFEADMKDLFANHFNIVDGPDDKDYPEKAVCFYTDKDYGGDVLCLGEGHDDLPDAMKDSVQSIKVLGGAGVWLYPKQYADPHAAFFTISCNNLGNSECRGQENTNLNKNVAAMWIKDADVTSQGDT